MVIYVSGGRGGDDGRGGRQARASRAATLIARLQVMQKDIEAAHFAVFRLNGNGLPALRKLSCVLDNWGGDAEPVSHQLVGAYGEEMKHHLETSLLPLLWNGAGESQTADTLDFDRFVRRLKGRTLPYSGIAFPVRLGAQGNGYVMFTAPVLDIASEMVLDMHGRSCQLMTDLFATDERRMHPSEALSERELDCLQMAGDGCISEEIAEKMGLSVHTVNAYLGAATTKLDSVNRIQAIAKAIRLGYIR